MREDTQHRRRKWNMDGSLHVPVFEEQEHEAKLRHIALRKDRLERGRQRARDAHQRYIDVKWRGGRTM